MKHSNSLFTYNILIQYKFVLGKKRTCIKQDGEYINIHTIHTIKEQI
jgi:hypothetical protein